MDKNIKSFLLTLHPSTGGEINNKGHSVNISSKKKIMPFLRIDFLVLHISVFIVYEYGNLFRHLAAFTTDQKRWPI